MPRTLVPIIVATMLASAVHADAVLEFSLDAGDAPETQTAYVADHMVAMTSAGGTNQDVLFDTVRGTMTIIHHGQRAFMRLDEQRIDELAEKAKSMISAIRAQLEEQLAALTEDRRAAVLSAMGGLPGAGDEETGPIDKTVSPTGERRRVAGFHCDVYRVIKNAKAVAEACVAWAETLGLEPADFEALRAMQVFGDKLASKLSHLMGSSGTAMPEIGASGFDGIAISVTDLDADPPTRVVLTEVRRTPVPRKKLSVPAGYTEQALRELLGATQ